MGLRRKKKLETIGTLDIYVVSLCFTKEARNKLSVKLLCKDVKASNKQEAFGMVYDSDHKFKSYQLHTSNVIKIESKT